MTTIVGIDASLTSTGWARITYEPAGGCHSHHHTVELGTITSHPADNGRLPDGKKAPQTLADRETRLTRLRAAIIAQCRGADLVAIEGPSFASNSAGTWDRAGNWWLIVTGLARIGVPVCEIPPSTVKKLSCDKGNGSKTDVAAGVSRMWPDVYPHGDDQFDALALASAALVLSVPRVTADQAGMPFRVLERHREALSKVQLPTSPQKM